MRAISPSSIPPSPFLSSFQVRTGVPVSLLFTFSSGIGGCSSSSRRKKILGAVDRDSEYEIDRDKALAALEQLDQQLKTLSEKETIPSNKRSSSSSPYSDAETVRREMIGMAAEQSAEISGSTLAAAAVGLIILTIVNNLLFGVFVKPYVDGEDLASVVPGQRSEGPVERTSASQDVDFSAEYLRFARNWSWLRVNGDYDLANVEPFDGGYAFCPVPEVNILLSMILPLCTLL